MAVIDKNRLQLMQVVSAAHTAAAARARIMVSLLTARPPEGHLTCLSHDLDISEVHYPGYQRKKLGLMPNHHCGRDPGRALRSDAHVIFDVNRSEYPVVITHMALHDETGGRRALAPLNRAIVLQPGDCASFPAGAITAPDLEHWEAA